MNLLVCQVKLKALRSKNGEGGKLKIPRTTFRTEARRYQMSRCIQTNFGDAYEQT